MGVLASRPCSSRRVVTGSTSPAVLAEVSAGGPLFTAGKADAQVSAFSFDQPDAHAFAERTVQLTGAKAAKAK
jgi:hypothetical protein